jgi:hypothetical protein
VDTEKKRRAKSDKLALEELVEEIEPVEPVEKRVRSWLPKLGDVLNLQPTRAK